MKKGWTEDRQSGQSGQVKTRKNCESGQAKGGRKKGKFNGKREFVHTNRIRKKRAAQCWKKLHGRCAELHIPAEIDGLPVIAVAENAFAAEREAPLRKSARRRRRAFPFDGAACRNRGGAGIAKGFPAGYGYGNWGVCLFGLCRIGAGTSAGD